jgi:beta-mannosidase
MRKKIFVLAAAFLSSSLAMGWMRPGAKELTAFQFRQLDKKTASPEGDFIPAEVPGDVITDLVRAGKLPDPYYEFNSLEAQWVNKKDWLYRAEFPLAPREGRRAFILFMGVDYMSRIEFNEKLLEKHEGMFSRILLEITGLLKDDARNRLDVILMGIPDHPLEKLGPKIIQSSELGRKDYLKTQMSFGWDFAPRLKGAGIWDKVLLFETGPAMFREIAVSPENNGLVKVMLDIDSSERADAELRLAIKGKIFKGFALEKNFHLKLPAGQSKKSFEINVENPRLWWPWDMGRPELYQLEAEILVDGKSSDLAAETFGFREISWQRNEDAKPHHADWVLLLNGKREFMRGANWVPADALHGRLTDERYKKLVKMAHEANINMLRIWGGGNRERASFYEACDRQGIMVWQEFPFACVFIIGIPGNERFLQLVRQETSEMARQLRNHPSLVMWCGGNEFNVKKGRKAVEVMEDVTAELDPQRRFIPASPYKGDTHNWMVWHSFGNLQDYFNDTSPLPSEFGLQAFPSMDTLKKYISGDLLWPLGEVHAHHNLGKDKMEKYVSAIIPGGADNCSGLEEYANASQKIQAHYLQRGIEFWRQRKYKTSGTFFWQLNEPWPAICWSVIDYEFRPKLSYQQLKDTYNPLLVSAQFEDKKWHPGDEFKAKIFIVNDYHESFGNIRVEAGICGDKAAEFFADIPPDSVTIAGEISATLPQDKAPVLELSAFRGKEILSKNQYDLSIHDPIPSTTAGKSGMFIGRWIMTGKKPREEYLDQGKNRN